MLSIVTNRRDDRQPRGENRHKVCLWCYKWSYISKHFNQSTYNPPKACFNLLIYLIFFPIMHCFSSLQWEPIFTHSKLNSSDVSCCSLQASATSSASSSTFRATPEIPAIKKTKTRRTSTTMAGPFTSGPSPSSWLNQWAFLPSTYILRKTKRRASEPDATSLRPPPPHHTHASQVTATDEDAHDPAPGRPTHPVSLLQSGWRLVAEVVEEVEAEEGWGWGCLWGIYPCMLSAGTLWRVEVRRLGPTARRGTVGFYKSTTVSRKI